MGWPLRMNADMQIQGNISNPSPKRDPQISFVFKGVPVQKEQAEDCGARDQRRLCSGHIILCDRPLISVRCRQGSNLQPSAPEAARWRPKAVRLRCFGNLT